MFEEGREGEKSGPKRTRTWSRTESLELFLGGLEYTMLETAWNGPKEEHVRARWGGKLHLNRLFLFRDLHNLCKGDVSMTTKWSWFRLRWQGTPRRPHRGSPCWARYCPILVTRESIDDASRLYSFCHFSFLLSLDVWRRVSLIFLLVI